MPPKARNPVKSTRTSFEILEALADAERIGVTELADQLDVSKGSISNHLSTLNELGYVVSENSQYRLACSFLRFGTIARNQKSISAVGKEHVERLANVTGEQSGVVTIEHDYAVYLHTEPGEKEDMPELIAGLRVPLHCTAPGKALLAHLPQERIESTFEGYDRLEWTDTTITDTDELQKELGVIREQGLAFNRGEYRPDQNGLAAPIFQDGRVFGAVGIAGPKARVSGKTLQQDAAGLVVSVANQIETDLNRT